MKLTSYKVSAAIALSAFIAVGCSDASETSTVSQEKLLEEVALEGEDAEMQSFYLPSALQIGSIFQKSGLPYVVGISNPVANAELYTSRSNKLLNFGIYSADLAYAVLNDQPQISMEYLRAIQSLSDKIGLGSVFQSEELLKRFERNLGNQDSIINVLIDIQAETDMFVDDNNMYDITYIIFAGAWVEGMYIGVKAADVKNAHTISSRLVEQMTILDNLNKALKSSDNKTEEVLAVSKDLMELEKFFNQLKENKDAKNIASFKDYQLTPEHIKELSDRIVALRNKITQV
jgi:hypothetical protein